MGLRWVACGAIICSAACASGHSAAPKTVSLRDRYTIHLASSSSAGHVSVDEILRLADRAATFNHGRADKVEWVYSTHEAAEEVASGAIIPTGALRRVILIQVIGKFYPDIGGPRRALPPGSDARPREPARSIVTDIDAQSGNTTDDGFNPSPVDLAKLGPVSTATLRT